MTVMLRAANAEYTPVITSVMLPIIDGVKAILPRKGGMTSRSRQMRGFGDVGDALDKAIDGFLLKAPHPSSTDASAFLQLYSGDDRIEAARRLIERGVPATTISNALAWLDTAGKLKTSTITGALTVAAAAGAAYHGYRRNNSIFWGGVWFACGMLFPIFSTAIALAQGYGKEKK